MLYAFICLIAFCCNYLIHNKKSKLPFSNLLLLRCVRDSNQRFYPSAYKAVMFIMSMNGRLFIHYKGKHLFLISKYSKHLFSKQKHYFSIKCLPLPLPLVSILPSSLIPLTLNSLLIACCIYSYSSLDTSIWLLLVSVHFNANSI